MLTLLLNIALLLVGAGVGTCLIYLVKIIDEIFDEYIFHK